MIRASLAIAAASAIRLFRRSRQPEHCSFGNVYHQDKRGLQGDIMKVPKLLRPTALSGALLAAAVASVPSSAEAASPTDYDYGYGDQAYAPTFGYDAAYYVRPLGYGGFRQFGGWYGQPYGYGGYYVYGYRGRWSRR